ncbi:Z-ring formation inhibitor MciZ [Fredinandcohnia humi]
MKIVIRPNSITMVGKAWEIRAKLKEYSRSFETIQQWIDNGKEE